MGSIRALKNLKYRSIQYLVKEKLNINKQPELKCSWPAEQTVITRTLCMKTLTGDVVLFWCRHYYIVLEFKKGHSRNNATDHRWRKWQSTRAVQRLLLFPLCSKDPRSYGPYLSLWVKEEQHFLTQGKHGSDSQCSMLLIEMATVWKMFTMQGCAGSSSTPSPTWRETAVREQELCISQMHCCLNRRTECAAVETSHVKKTNPPSTQSVCVNMSRKCSLLVVQTRQRIYTVQQEAIGLMSVLILSDWVLYSQTLKKDKKRQENELSNICWLVSQFRKGVKRTPPHIHTSLIHQWKIQCRKWTRQEKYLQIHFIYIQEDD